MYHPFSGSGTSHVRAYAAAYRLCGPQGTPVRRRRQLRLDRLRFRRLPAWLQHCVWRLFGYDDFTVTERPVPRSLITTCSGRARVESTDGFDCLRPAVAATVVVAWINNDVEQDGQFRLGLLRLVEIAPICRETAG